MYTFMLSSFAILLLKKSSDRYIHRENYNEVLCSLYPANLVLDIPPRLNLNGLNFKYYSFGYKRKMEVAERGAGSARFQSISDNAF